jgi:hypothetical protein
VILRFEPEAELDGRIGEGSDRLERNADPLVPIIES